MRDVSVRVGGVSSVLSVLLVALVGPATFAQTRTPLVTNDLATVYRIDLPARTRTTVTPTTVHGLAWVAITDGTVVVDGVPKDVRQGAAEWRPGAAAIGLRAGDTRSARFVVADLSSVCEIVDLSNYGSAVPITPPGAETDRTLHGESLPPGVYLDEGLGGGAELFVAVAPLFVKDEVDRSWEDEPMKWSEPVLMHLAAGEVRWTKPGRHRFTNGGKTNARFVIVRWWWTPPIRK